MMRRMWMVSVVGCLGSVANAAPSYEPLVVTAVASSEEKEFPAAAALTEWPGEKAEGWCAPQGAGATLTLTFDRAEALGEVELHSAYSKEKPAKVEITTDRGTFEGAWRSGNPWIRVELDPVPTKKLVIKIVSVEGGPRACLHRLYVRGANRNRTVPLFVGVTPAQLAAVKTAWRAANDALERCDAGAIATTIAFPIEVTVNFPMDNPDDWKDPLVAKYANAAQLTAACKKERSVLALGYLGEGYGSTLDVDWMEGEVKSSARGEVRVGSRWKLALAGDRWRVTEISYDDPVTVLDRLSTPLQEWVDSWLLVKKPQYFTPDARISLLHVKQWRVPPQDLFGYVAVSPDDKLGPVTTDAQTLARDGEAMWMTVVRKVGKRELRATAFAVPSEQGWQIATAFVSFGRPNGEVNKAAAAGKSPQFEPLPPLVGEKSLIEAVRALFTGPLDPLASARKDLIALGSGPGEKTLGGAKLAAPWKAAWANKLALAGGAVTMSPTKTTAFVLVDAQLDKGKYKIPFRIALVFDRAGTGGWTLAHAHFATP